MRRFHLGYADLLPRIMQKEFPRSLLGNSKWMREGCHITISYYGAIRRHDHVRHSGL